MVADAGLLDFLDHLIDWVRDLPLYVLVVARPELGLARPRFGSGRNRLTLTLDPLDQASVDQPLDPAVRRLAADAAVLGTSSRPERWPPSPGTTSQWSGSGWPTWSAARC